MSVYVSAVASFLLPRGPHNRDLRALLPNVSPTLSKSSTLGSKLYFQHGLEGVPEKSDLMTPPRGQIEPDNSPHLCPCGSPSLFSLKPPSKSGEGIDKELWKTLK